jgi:aspartokinase/homoserine dehydrogenase 1
MGVFGIDLFYGCLSGTMNFVSQRLNEEAEFSSAINEAMSPPRQYTEPDPRVDLAGLDFARKLVILSRLAGESVDLDNIIVDNLVPKEFQDLSLTDFLELLDGMDSLLQIKLEAAKNNGKKLWFLGSANFNKKKFKVGFDELPVDDPIVKSKESDNVLKIYPKGWRRPVTVMGPGAGIRETVTGLISKLSNIP